MSATQDIQLFDIFQYAVVAIGQRPADIVNQLLNQVSFAQCLALTNQPEQVERAGLAGYKHIGTFSEKLTVEDRKKMLTSWKNFALRVLVSSDQDARILNTFMVNLVLILDAPVSLEAYMDKACKADFIGSTGASITILSTPQDLANFVRMVKSGNLNVKFLNVKDHPVPYDLTFNANFFAESISFIESCEKVVTEVKADAARASEERQKKVPSALPKETLLKANRVSEAEAQTPPPSVSDAQSSAVGVEQTHPGIQPSASVNEQGNGSNAQLPATGVQQSEPGVQTSVSNEEQIHPSTTVVVTEPQSPTDANSSDSGVTVDHSDEKPAASGENVAQAEPEHVAQDEPEVFGRRRQPVFEHHDIFEGQRKMPDRVNNVPASTYKDKRLDLTNGLMFKIPAKPNLWSSPSPRPLPATDEELTPPLAVINVPAMRIYYPDYPDINLDEAMAKAKAEYWTFEPTEAQKFKFPVFEKRGRGRGGGGLPRGGFNNSRGGFSQSGDNQGGSGFGRGGFGGGNHGDFNQGSQDNSSRGGFGGNRGGFNHGSHENSGFGGNRGGFNHGSQENSGFNASRGGFGGFNQGSHENSGFASSRGGNRGGFNHGSLENSGFGGNRGGNSGFNQGFQENSSRGGFKGNRGGFNQGSHESSGFASNRGGFGGNRGGGSGQFGDNQESAGFGGTRGGYGNPVRGTVPTRRFTNFS